MDQISPFLVFQDVTSTVTFLVLNRYVIVLSKFQMSRISNDLPSRFELERYGRYLWEARGRAKFLFEFDETANTLLN